MLNQPFTAAPARLAPVNDRWQVVFTSPTGGWRAEFDTTRRMFDGWEVFVTLITPRADEVVTQAQTELHVLTPVSTEEKIRVYARTTPDENPGENPPGLFHWLFGWLLPADTGPVYQPAAEETPAPRQRAGADATDG